MGKKGKAASGGALPDEAPRPDNGLTSFPALGASLTPSPSTAQWTAAAAAPAQRAAPAWGGGIHRAAAGGSTQPPAASTEGCQAAQPSPVERSAAASVPPCVYQVNGSRKGGFPVQLETRKNGKKVTVIRNVTGDTTVLLKDLKSLVGAGGVVRDGDVEVQGEHIARIEAMLVKKGCLKGVQAAVKAAAAPKVAEKAPGRSIARLDAKAIELKSKQR